MTVPNGLTDAEHFAREVRDAIAGYRHVVMVDTRQIRLQRALDERTKASGLSLEELTKVGTVARVQQEVFAQHDRDVAAVRDRIFRAGYDDRRATDLKRQIARSKRPPSAEQRLAERRGTTVNGEQSLLAQILATAKDQQYRGLRLKPTRWLARFDEEREHPSDDISSFTAYTERVLVDDTGEVRWPRGLAGPGYDAAEAIAAQTLVARVREIQSSRVPKELVDAADAQQTARSLAYRYEAAQRSGTVRPGHYDEVALSSRPLPEPDPTAAGDHAGTP